jgi:probable HAF family extracellular repeat protein
MTVVAFGTRKRRLNRRWTFAGGLMATTALVFMPAAKAQMTPDLIDFYEETYRAYAVAGLSSNGTRAALNGWAGERGLQALYWNGESVEGLGGFDRAINSMAGGISGDGRVVVGSSVDPYVRQRAFRWEEGGALTDIGTLRTDNQGTSSAMGTNHDGSIIVGRSQSWLNQEIAFAWVMGDTGGQSVDGQMYALMPLLGDDEAEARAVSRDGRFAVGVSEADLHRRATLWSIADRATGGNAIELEGLAGLSSEANGISDNGAVIVGSSWDAMAVSRAVRWTDGGTTVHILEGIEDHRDSYGVVVSGDGTVIGGYSTDVDSIAYGFRWTEAEGAVDAGEWLEGKGINLGVMRVADVQALSYSGNVMGGTMVDEDGEERAYIARIAEEPGPGGNPPPGNGIMDVGEYHATLYSAGGIANAGEFLSWLPMNGAHHRPLMLTPNLTGDMCAWATGDFAHHAGSSANLALADAGACVDLAGGSVRLGGSAGTTASWQTLALGGSMNMTGQYVLGEADWQPDGTPLLLSVTGMLGGWNARIDRAYSNGADTAISNGNTNAFGGVVRMRADWLEAAVIGNTSINPYASIAFGALHVDGYQESGGPFPARFDAQTYNHADLRLGVTAVTELSTETKLSTTLEVAHRTGRATAASGAVDGLFNFALGGGQYGQTWVRGGLELDHKITEGVALSGSVHLASNGRDPSLALSAGLKGAF